MNIENVKKIAEILIENGLTYIETGEGDNKIKLKKEIFLTSSKTEPVIETKTSPDVSAADADDNSIDFNRLTAVQSPLVGVYYSSPSPDAEPFAVIGNKVKKGDVLCIIETMKLMNEITAETDGEIVDICVKNGDIVEFGQVLFKLY